MLTHGSLDVMCSDMHVPNATGDKGSWGAPGMDRNWKFSKWTASQAFASQSILAKEKRSSTCKNYTILLAEVLTGKRTYSVWNLLTLPSSETIVIKHSYFHSFSSNITQNCQKNYQCIFLNKLPFQFTAVIRTSFKFAGDHMDIEEINSCILERNIRWAMEQK